MEVFVVHGNLCHSLCAKDGKLLVTEVPELHADHEEADTRLLLHCAYASQRQAHSQYDPQKAVMIRSPDTDVFIIALAFAGVMTSKVLFHTGRGTNVRTIDVTSIKDHLGADVSSALIWIHCLTGCDSVSAFYGKGKIKALKLMLEDESFVDVFSKLGEHFDMSADVYDKLEEFVCCLHGSREEKRIIVVRYYTFRLESKFERSLPLNQDSLHEHFKRANYQAAVHRRATAKQVNAPNPTSYGWKMEMVTLSSNGGTYLPRQEIFLQNLQK